VDDWLARRGYVYSSVSLHRPTKEVGIMANSNPITLLRAGLGLDWERDPASSRHDAAGLVPRRCSPGRMNTMVRKGLVPFFKSFPAPGDMAPSIVGPAATLGEAFDACAYASDLLECTVKQVGRGNLPKNSKFALPVQFGALHGHRWAVAYTSIQGRRLELRSDWGAEGEGEGGGLERDAGLAGLETAFCKMFVPVRSLVLLLLLLLPPPPPPPPPPPQSSSSQSSSSSSVVLCIYICILLLSAFLLTVGAAVLHCPTLLPPPAQMVGERWLHCDGDEGAVFADRLHEQKQQVGGGRGGLNPPPDGDGAGFVICSIVNQAYGLDELHSSGSSLTEEEAVRAIHIGLLGKAAARQQLWGPPRGE
jgi:hypothetical protein